MTANQIAYQTMLETHRANLAREEENKRSNLAREKETHRSNINNEAIARFNAATSSYNARTQRGKVVTDAIYGGWKTFVNDPVKMGVDFIGNVF